MGVPFGQAVPFLHPELAWAGLAAATLPILIHLIWRRRYRRLVWAAMQFLERAHRRSARRVRIEQWLLLLTRVALIALMALALARPVLSTAALTSYATPRAHHIVVIDDSLSMQASTSDGSTRLNRAKTWAMALAETFSPRDSVTLIRTSTPKQSLMPLAAQDGRLIRETIAEIEASQRPDDFPGAWAAALDALGDSDVPAGGRTVYVLSDFSGNAWAGEETLDVVQGTGTRASESGGRFAAFAGAVQRSGDRLVLLPTTSGEAVENVAVVKLEPESPFVTPGFPVRIRTEVANLGDRPVSGVSVQISHGGRIIRRQPLAAIEPGGSAVVRSTVELPSSGLEVLEAVVATSQPDQLPVDDARRLVVDARQRIRVLLVEGRSGGAPGESDGFYLAKALAPHVGEVAGDWSRSGTGRAGAFEPVLIGAAELQRQTLGDYQAIILCNVGSIGESTHRRLEAYVREGGGLGVFIGERMDAESFASSLGQWLPVGIEPRESREADSEPGWGFRLPDRPHVISREFGAQPESGLFRAAVRKRHALSMNDPASQAVLEFDDGAAAVGTAALGRGRILVAGFAADMNWSSLPARGDFVPLVVNATAFLTGAEQERHNLIVGETARRTLRPEEAATPVRVRGDQVTEEARLVSADGRLAAEYGPIERAGVYDWLTAGAVRPLAANVEVSESSIRPASEGQIQRAFGEHARVATLAAAVDIAGQGGRRLELATAGLYGVLLLLFVEAWLAGRFGARRRNSGGAIQ